MEEFRLLLTKMCGFAALASCLKSAHLTLFHLLGYRYALSYGGYVLGKEILCDFVLKTRKMKRRRALEEAKVHFGKYQSLVRPVVSLSFDSKGTLTDGILFVCETGGKPWAGSRRKRSTTGWAIARRWSGSSTSTG